MKTPRQGSRGLMLQTIAGAHPGTLKGSWLIPQPIKVCWDHGATSYYRHGTDADVKAQEP
jgi:hypothetical protein